MPFRIRQASLGDAATVCAHRRAMFSDMGHQDEAALDAMITEFLPWVEKQMSAGHYLAWFLTTNSGEIVAGLGLWLMDWPPHMIAPAKPRANILNVYTHPEFRRLGLARRLMDTALEHCRAHGIRNIILHASPAGRALYAAMGFSQTNEMRLILED